jgi:Uncharacterised nucleotidyltransferase
MIARALVDPGAAPASIETDAASLIAAASRHRVLLLLGWTLRTAGRLNDWPPQFIDALQRAERAAVVEDALQHVELVNVLDELGTAGVRAVLFKGAALAHTHYPAPYVRVRADTDLLVPASELAALDRVLGRLGYVRPAETSGRLVSYQGHYHKIDRHGVAHAFDVHWKISNLQVLADRFTWQELWRCRLPVAALGASAVTIDDVHALLLALVHRAGHHPGSHNLLWIYDLHLLASRLRPTEMSQVQEMAAARGLGQVAADGLALARDRFGNRAADPVIDGLRARGVRQDDAMLIQGSWTQARVLRLDLDALPNWRSRGRLIREHLLPPSSYMRARYGVRSKLLLPALYVWRALLGAPKWLRPRSTDD